MEAKDVIQLASECGARGAFAIFTKAALETFVERVQSAQSERIARLEEALRRIALAKPDRLDHSVDVGIIERAARIASDALESKA